MGIVLAEATTPSNTLVKSLPQYARQNKAETQEHRVNLGCGITFCDLFNLFVALPFVFTD